MGGEGAGEGGRAGGQLPQPCHAKSPFVLHQDLFGLTEPFIVRIIESVSCC